MLEHFHQYDGFEVHPLLLIDDRSGQRNYEPCDREDPNLFCWGVYGHTPGIGITSLADCATEKDAEDLAALLQNHKILLTHSPTR